MIKRILAACLFVLLGHNAKAGILVEPYLGYHLSAADLTLGDGSGAFSGQSVKYDLTGLGYGLRLGYEIPLLFFAVDYSLATLSSSIKEQPAGLGLTTSNQSSTSLGLTVGANFPLVRPYVGYIFDDQAKDDSSTLVGSGFKLGVGLGVFPMVKINAEYQMRTWTKSKSSSGTEETFGQSGTIKSLSGSGFFVNVSVPLSF